MKPAVSIIVPVYNVEKYLRRCVNSLINQTLDNIEIILVDDGSPDSCGEICDELSRKDGRIKVIHKKNQGLGFARNSGIEKATGDFAAFVDSDDYVDPNMFEGLYKQAVSSNSQAVISGGFINKYNNGATVVNRETDEIKFFNSNELNRKLILEMTGSLPSCKKDYVYEMSACKGIYKLKTLNDYNIRFHCEKEFISEDLVFHFDLFRHTDNVVIIPDIYYYYCENDISLTKAYNSKRFEQNIKLYNYMLSQFKSFGFPGESKLYLDRFLLARARVAISQIEKHYKFYGRQAKKEIKKITLYEELNQILLSYPINKLPIKQRIFVKLLKHNFIFFAYFLTKLNNLI